MVPKTQERITGAMAEEENNDTAKKGLINASFGIASTIIATLLIGLYVQIGSSAQELIRLQEQVKGLQKDISQYNGLGTDVKALQFQTDLLSKRIDKIELKNRGQ